MELTSQDKSIDNKGKSEDIECRIAYQILMYEGLNDPEFHP